MVQGKKSTPCYQCSERSIGCHALCPKYAEYSARNEIAKRKDHDEKLMDTICYNMAVEASKRRKKRKNLRHE